MSWQKIFIMSHCKIVFFIIIIHLLKMKANMQKTIKIMVMKYYSANSHWIQKMKTKLAQKWLGLYALRKIKKIINTDKKNVKQKITRLKMTSFNYLQLIYKLKIVLPTK